MFWELFIFLTAENWQTTIPAGSTTKQFMSHSATRVVAAGRRHRLLVFNDDLPDWSGVGCWAADYQDEFLKVTRRPPGSTNPEGETKCAWAPPQAWP